MLLFFITVLNACLAMQDNTSIFDAIALTSGQQSKINALDNAKFIEFCGTLAVRNMQEAVLVNEDGKNYITYLGRADFFNDCAASAYGRYSQSKGVKLVPIFKELSIYSIILCNEALNNGSKIQVVSSIVDALTSRTNIDISTDEEFQSQLTIYTAKN